MEGPKPLDPPPCPDLQLVLAVCRDLVDPLIGSGSIGVGVDGLGNVNFASKGGMVSVDIPTLGGELSTCCQQGGAQKLDTGSLSGWKSVLVGTTMSNSNIENPKITRGKEGPVIALPDSIMDNVTSGLKLCVVGRFVSFHPTIENVQNGWIKSGRSKAL